MPKAKGATESIGPWAFYIGLVIAILAAFVVVPTSKELIFVLGLLGIIVGLLNITAKEVAPYLTASIALLIAAMSIAKALEIIPGVSLYIGALLNNIVYFVGPGAAIVALKEIYEIAK